MENDYHIITTITIILPEMEMTVPHYFHSPT